MATEENAETAVELLTEAELLAGLPEMARDCVPALLSDDQLIRFVEYCRRNMKKPGYPAVTYDEAMREKLVPELLKRLACRDERERCARICEAMVVGGRAWNEEQAVAADALFAAAKNIRDPEICP